MADVVEIHVVCRNRLGVASETPQSFESGDWSIGAKHLRPGVVFALHEEKTQQSYLQGRIEGSRLVRDLLYVVAVQRTFAPLPWKGGGGRGKGYLWGGADWRFLPQIPITINGLQPGGNHALKNLNEANPDNFEFPRLGTFAKEGEEISGRQRAFYQYLLRIALAREDRSIPYAFRDAVGQPYRLDDGAVGRAIYQGVLEEPQSEQGGTVQEVTITERYWLDRENDGTLGRLRQQDRNQDGVGLDLFEEFDPAMVSLDSIRREVLTTREARPGQQEFRRGLLRAYGFRCAVTGCAAEQALDAAHIIPDVLLRDSGMHPQNGLHPSCRYS